MRAMADIKRIARAEALEIAEGAALSQAQVLAWVDWCTNRFEGVDIAVCEQVRVDSPSVYRSVVDECALLRDPMKAIARLCRYSRGEMP